ncbi:hypothetical protein [Tengunoibacter tsumagoiensis]|uniref:Uncharacterized protein n=1 Tax=Tengunoibacter tsumagoiensis TaxID=2014871 RepID=A0A401ZY12_9CHLR|nr:hypothetical protein [Tengunoibacter tsumagoiensis]GCE11722.1 hypothetical protein KTT_15810 [Tengunoibacter tsumagoiensis]
MTEKISYPFDDMSTTSKDLRTFIHEQWTQHDALFMQNPDSYATITQSIANLIPDGKGKSHELKTALASYHQQFHSCYDALHTLAEQIDKASQQMGQTDTDVKKSFEQSPKGFE